MDYKTHAEQAARLDEQVRADEAARAERLREQAETQGMVDAVESIDWDEQARRVVANLVAAARDAEVAYASGASERDQRRAEDTLRALRSETYDLVLKGLRQ